MGKRPLPVDEDSSDSEGEGPQLLKKSSKTDEDDGLDDEERARLRDLKERDEYAACLQQKYEDKTRHTADTRDKRAFEEAARRLHLEKEDRDKCVPTLRVESRRNYLVKRKDDNLKELEADIKDDEYLFDEKQLTEREAH